MVSSGGVSDARAPGAEVEGGRENSQGPAWGRKNVRLATFSARDEVDGESPVTGGASSSTTNTDADVIAPHAGESPSKPNETYAEAEVEAATGEQTTTEVAHRKAEADPEATTVVEQQLQAKDLFQGSLAQTPWQYQGYRPDSATWLAAAQRRHAHRRRTNSLLGIGSVDLSGPHEPTPIPGAKVGQRPAQYFLVLTFALDRTVGHKRQATQTDTGEADPDEPLSLIHI